MPTKASASQRAGCVMAKLIVRTAQMKSPVSLQSVNHPSTHVPMIPPCASPLTRSAMAKWTVRTAQMKDPFVVMFNAFLIHTVYSKYIDIIKHGKCTIDQVKQLSCFSIYSQKKETAKTCKNNDFWGLLCILDFVVVLC